MTSPSKNENALPNAVKDKVKIKTIIMSIILLVLFVLLISAISVYGFSAENKISKIALKIIPYPAAMVGGNFISINALNENTYSVRQFYETQDFGSQGYRVDFTTDDGQKRLEIKKKWLLEKMIENVAIMQLAEKRGIKISNEQVDQNVKRKLDEYGSETQVTEELQKLYGWSLEDFKEKIVNPSLYIDALKKNVESENAEAFAGDARKKIQEAMIELEAAKDFLEEDTDFSDIAKKYSDGSSGEQGGEIGWIKKDQLVIEIADQVFQMEVGKTSEILESQLGFHIILVEEKKVEDGKEIRRIRQIFAKKTTFADWLTGEMKKMNIRVLIRDYSWNKSEARVDFRDQYMVEYENNLNNVQNQLY